MSLSALAYLAHILGGDVAANLARAKQLTDDIEQFPADLRVREFPRSNP